MQEGGEGEGAYLTESVLMGPDTLGDNFIECQQLVRESHKPFLDTQLKKRTEDAASRLDNMIHIGHQRKAVNVGL